MQTSSRGSSWTGRGRSGRKGGPRPQPYNRNKFLQANFRFLVSDAANLKRHEADADLMLDWDDIVQVTAIDCWKTCSNSGAENEVILSLGRYSMLLLTQKQLSHITGNVNMMAPGYWTGGDADNAAAAMPHIPGDSARVSSDHALRPCVRVPFDHGAPHEPWWGQSQEGISLPALLPAHRGSRAAPGAHPPGCAAKGECLESPNICSAVGSGLTHHAANCHGQTEPEIANCADRR